MAGRRRGRTGRGWDAAPPRDRPRPPGGADQANKVPNGEAAYRADEAERAGTGLANDPAEVARKICLRQLAVRPYTRAELAQVLRRRGIPRDVADEVLDRYSEVGIVDDGAFARAWVSSRHHGRGLARRALAGELRRKGVDSRVVGEALDELDETTEAETARALVERKLRTDRGASPESTFRRLVAMLARKGYPPQVALRVVRQAMFDREDTAGFAAAVDVDALEADVLAGDAAEAVDGADASDAESTEPEPA
jgi:regulatory protein